MSDRRWLLAWAVGYAAVGAASLAIPLYALVLGGTPLLVGVLASTAAFAGVPGAVVWGRRADRTHRQRFLALALAAIGLALLVTAALTVPWLLVVPNALVWFVTAAATPVLTLAGVDGRPEPEWDREIGRLNAAQGFGWVAGLLVGTVWTTGAARFFPPATVHRLLFGGIAVATLVASVLGYRWMPAGTQSPTAGPGDDEGLVKETTSSSTSPESWSDRITHWFRPTSDIRRQGGLRSVAAIAGGRLGGGWRLGARWWRDAGHRGDGLARVRTALDGSSPLAVYLAGVTLCFLGFASFFGPLPAFLVDRRYSADQIFLLFVVSSAAAAVCYDPAATVAERVDGRRLHVGALAVRGLALPVVALVGAPDTGLGGFAPLVALFALVGASWAVVAVTAGGLVTRLAPDSGRGNALGAYTALSNVGTGIGSAVGGLVAVHLGYVTAFAGGAVLVLVGAATVLRSRSARA